MRCRPRDLDRELASGPIRVRVGLHTGTPLLTEEGYVGGDVHRAARIAAVGHGGQVLVSSPTAALGELDGFATWAIIGSRTSPPPSASTSSVTASSRRSSRSTARTYPCPAPRSSVARRSSQRCTHSSREDARLLTLTGPGGTGKTRLALQAAAEASEAFPDGVWWVPLAPLRDPALVLETAARVVGSKNGLAEHIRDKSMLCLFDNFEQVVDAASELAPSCPTVPT